MPRRKSWTEKLEDLRQAEVKARQRDREATAASNLAGGADLEDAHEALVAAHTADDPAAVRSATAARVKANKIAEDRAVEAEAAGRRVQQAERDRQQFEGEHHAELITELEPEARAIVDRMQDAVSALIFGDAEWQALRQRVATLVIASGGEGRNVPHDHGLESVLHDWKRTAPVVAAPLPRRPEFEVMATAPPRVDHLGESAA